MKSLIRQTSCLFSILILGLTLLPIDGALARGGRGGGGGGRGGGGGASPRMSSGGANRSGGGMQNRGSFDSGSRAQSRSTGQANRQSSSQNRQTNRQSGQSTRQDSRQTNQGDRQATSQNRQENRQSTSQNRQGERTERTDTRQQQATNRTDTRQQGATDRQNNRQNFVDDNNNWYNGGGWYGGGYGVPPGWGWVGLTTGLVLGAAVASPPPYYDIVYVGSTSYMYSDGVYLQPSGDEYVVVAPPPGATVAYLPDGCTSLVSNGVSYFNCSGIYYQPYFQNGIAVYQVIQLD